VPKCSVPLRWSTRTCDNMTGSSSITTHRPGGAAGRQWQCRKLKRQACQQHSNHAQLDKDKQHTERDPSGAKEQGSTLERAGPLGTFPGGEHLPAAVSAACTGSQ
jgi:hypothetical protein